MRTRPRTAPLTRQRVATIQREMSERGFSLVPTPPVVSADLFLCIHKTRTLLNLETPAWRSYPPLVHYASWLEELLARALPDEAVSLTYLEYRVEPAGSKDPSVDKLHADGSYIRSVLTLGGPTTVYRDGAIERSVPAGHTLLMTATDRARAVGIPCTLHRRPGAGPRRTLLVCSFAPQPGPSSGNVYREMVERLRRSDRESTGRRRLRRELTPAG